MDFLKIDNGKLGAINFNNMIPVNDTNLSKIEISSIEDIQYKKLLENQLSWCNKTENIKNILGKAEKLYKYITNKMIKKIENYINEYPRVIFNGKSSKKIYQKKKLLNNLYDCITNMGDLL